MREKQTNKKMMMKEEEGLDAMPTWETLNFCVKNMIRIGPLDQPTHQPTNRKEEEDVIDR